MRRGDFILNLFLGGGGGGLLLCGVCGVTESISAGICAGVSVTGRRA